jgi:hypothetical protein
MTAPCDFGERGLVALGMDIAFAGEGKGGYTAGALQWQVANGNPTILTSGLL